MTVSTPAEREAYERLSALVEWVAEPRNPLLLQAVEMAIQLWLQDAALAESVVQSQWFQDGTTAHEVDVLQRFSDLAVRDLAVARMVAASPWFYDVISERERTLFDLLARGGPSPTFVSDQPEYAGSLTDDLLRFLIASNSNMSRELFAEVEHQPWFTDGLAPLEAAFAISLSDQAGGNPLLFDDLLRERFAATRLASLPLAGEVSLYVFQNSPIHDADAILDRIEATARAMERLLAVPFPVTEIILLIGDSTAVDYPIWGAGAHYGTHIFVTRNTSGVPAITHEVAHYYFYGSPGWLDEGGADFIELYVDDAVDIAIYDPPPEGAPAHNGLQCLAERGARNIRHFYALRHAEGLSLTNYCDYGLGEWLLLHLYDVMGEEAFAAGLVNWYQQQAGIVAAYGKSRVLRIRLVDTVAPESTTTEEELIYDSFSQAVPEHTREAFERVYREIHGGVFGGPNDDIPDDFGDTIETASPVSPGESLDGALEHAFDFDYFSFQATAGQKYEIDLEHATPTSRLALYDMPASRLYRGNALYERFGTVLLSFTPASRELTRNRLWIAPRSDRFDFAVQNFGGAPGPYRFSIVALEETPDDHGDNPASATEVTLAQPVEGTLDDERDFDYFRFQPVEGGKVRVEVVSLEGAPPLVCVYNSEGRISSGGPGGCSASHDGRGVYFNDYVSSTHARYLAVKGGRGVVRYTLSITAVGE